ncbi:MAG: DNA polymerase III subunit gamma/tau [Chloroflexi bacterium]|nr:DNA polymerase III subunit gamma/tau [Chloroflexota bacterium]
MSQALYRKWRPSTWDQVVGQEHVVQTLRNAVTSERVVHAYLFAGPRGTGKTTLARILAKAVNCLHDDLGKRPDDECDFCLSVNQGRFLDLIEIDAASNTSVEHVRDLRDKINFSPNQGRYKVYIIDEVHMLSTAAFNALLKTLEEPPAHAIFVLATTEVHKIPATVLSRCQRHEFRRIPVIDMVAHLKVIAKDEDIKIDKDALGLIARQATGSLRDAISLLDQLASTGKKITLDLTQTILGTATNQSVLDVVGALQAKDPAAGLEHINHTLNGGSDPRQFTRQIVDYLRDVMLVHMGNADQVDTTSEVRTKMASHAQAFTTPDLLRFIQIFNRAASERRGSWQPSLPLEMAFIESLQPPASELPIAAPQTTKVKSKKVEKSPAKTKPKSKRKAAPSEETPETRAVKKNWNEFMAAIKVDNPNTAALINSSRLREIRAGVLHLGFVSSVLKEKMESEDHQKIALSAAGNIFGEVAEVRCFITSANQASVPPDVDNSGMVATAIRLGGEIVDSSDVEQDSDE